MSADGEIKSMAVVAGALDGLDDDARGRVLRWAADRYKATLSVAHSRSSVNGASVDHSEFPDLATLYHQTAPRTDAEKALVAAYWFQVVEGSKEWESQPLNAALKNLGHGVSNITDALNSLQKRKPSLVMQVHKSGSSRQARKRYKVTAAGIDELRLMVKRGPEQKEN